MKALAVYAGLLLSASSAGSATASEMLPITTFQGSPQLEESRSLRRNSQAVGASRVQVVRTQLSGKPFPDTIAFFPDKFQLVICAGSVEEQCLAYQLPGVIAVAAGSGANAPTLALVVESGERMECTLDLRRRLACSPAGVGSVGAGLSSRDASGEAFCSRGRSGSMSCSDARALAAGRRLLLMPGLMGQSGLQVVSVRDGVASRCSAGTNGLVCTKIEGLDLFATQAVHRPVAAVSLRDGGFELIAVDDRSLTICRSSTRDQSRFSCSSEDIEGGAAGVELRIVKTRSRTTKRFLRERLVAVSTSTGRAFGKAGVEARVNRANAVNRALREAGFRARAHLSALAEDRTPKVSWSSYSLQRPVRLLSPDDDFGDEDEELPLYGEAYDSDGGFIGRWWSGDDGPFFPLSWELMLQTYAECIASCEALRDSEAQKCPLWEDAGAVAGFLGSAVAVLVVGLPSGGTGIVPTLVYTVGWSEGGRQAAAAACRAYAWLIYADCRKRC